MKQHDKTMTDLHRLLETQNFKSEADLRKFMDSLMGKPIPSFPKAVLTKQEQAQDLIYEANELPIAKAKMKAEEALQLDPDCIDAYELLGMLQISPQTALPFYKTGIDIGKRIFGGEYLEEHKGGFWGFHETRPFMRCMQHYSDCLYNIGRKEECVAILEEIIELNPDDNQGVRDQLLLYLMELNEVEKFKKYEKQFKDDAMAFASFNSALFAFKTEGENEKSNRLLRKAIKENSFVAAKIISNKPSYDLPVMYGIGDDNEAQ